MLLDRIFKNRNKWKEDTLNLIKNNLLSVKEENLKQYDQVAKTHLVCVYGKSQVGKTTLILNLIGLKDDNCKKEVAEVLRGGVARGNSSTSTAIIYSQSENEQYGLFEERLNAPKVQASIDYFSPDKMKTKLASIREAVEDKSFSDERIVHILIPKHLFHETAGASRLSILDLPGVDSRNFREKTHVENLMARYIPISSVCIIACPSNTIQSLETEKLPNDIEWKLLPNKYAVVLTKSYSNGIIKSYFDDPKGCRTDLFYPYVQKRYEKEISQILGNTGTRIFPLEIGDSFEQLITKELANSADRKEATEARDKTLSELEHFIKSHKEEDLQSAIEELRVVVEQSSDKKILELTEEREENLKTLEIVTQKTEEYQNRSEIYQSKIVENNKKRDSLNNLAQDLTQNSIHDNSAEQSAQLAKNIRRDIDIKQLSKDGKYFKDEKKVLLSSVSSFSISLAESIVSAVSSEMSRHELTIDLYESYVSKKIYNKFSNKHEAKLYPKRSLMDQFLGSGFPSLDLVYNYIDDLEKIAKDVIREMVIDPCIECVKKEIEKLDLENNIESDQLKKAQNKISEYTAKNDDINQKIESIKKDKEIIERQNDQNKQTLGSYLGYAEKAYLKQRKDVLEKINTSPTAEEKLVYALFLGVLDKDYYKLIHLANEQR